MTLCGKPLAPKRAFLFRHFSIDDRFRSAYVTPDDAPFGRRGSGRTDLIRGRRTEDMRKTMIVALAAAVALSAGAARADKTAQAFADPSATGANGFHNLYSGNKLAKTYSVGAAKASGCKIKVQFKGLTGLASGDKLICILGADACIIPPPADCTGLRFGNSVVTLVPYDTVLGKGATKVDTRDVGCGGVDASATNADITCYKPNIAYDPATQCAGQGGLWVPNPTFIPGTEATDGSPGLCQWFVPGSQRLAGPGTGVVAVDGISTAGPIP
jgi:hypothetical protein